MGWGVEPHGIGEWGTVGWGERGIVGYNMADMEQGIVGYKMADTEQGIVG